MAATGVCAVTAHPAEQSDASEPAPEPPVNLGQFLYQELRSAYSATVHGGADPEAVTADLTERLRRVRAMRTAAEGSADSPDGADRADSPDRPGSPGAADEGAAGS